MKFPKHPPARNPHFRAMARGRPCMLRIPGVCNGNPETTVLAHSNSGAHGKGLGMKSSDAYGVWACYACHVYIDQGPGDRGKKLELFGRAMLRMRSALEQIVSDALAPVKDKDAAAWALRESSGEPM